MDRHEAQIEMEKTFNRNQLMPRIMEELKNPTYKLEEYMVKHAIDPKFGFKLMAQMILHRRCDPATLCGVLFNHYEDAQATMDAIKRCAEHDLVDYNPSLRLFIVRIMPTNDVLYELERYQYPMPMIVEPKKVQNNMDSGYFTHKCSIILKKNHHEDDVNLDHINRMNRVKLRLNLDALHHIKNKWKGVDKPRAGDTFQEFQKRQKAFKQYCETSGEIHSHLLMHGNEFHITWAYDKRGRSYSRGYHVNPQGNEYNKASIEFAEGEIIPLE